MKELKERLKFLKKMYAYHDELVKESGADHQIGANYVSRTLKTEILMIEQIFKGMQDVFGK